jgi:hypothetical protein
VLWKLQLLHVLSSNSVLLLLLHVLASDSVLLRLMVNESMRDECVHAGIWWYIGTVRHPHTLEAHIKRMGTEDDVPNSWIYFYSGLEVENIWEDSVAISKQILFSCYWAASTLSTNSLVGNATPKNALEILFTIWCAVRLSVLCSCLQGATNP